MRHLPAVAFAAALALGAASCAEPAPPPATPSPAPPAFDRATAEHDVAAVLDDAHDAASHADEPRYFAHYAPNGVFLGTDATERWDMTAFRAYAHDRFAKGRGWTLHVVHRSVDFSADGDVAWFDEELRGDRLGPARGSGVLVHASRAGGGWLVAQYNLAVTVPNERFADLRALLDAPPPPADLKARYQDAYKSATAAAASGDLARARALLEALVPEAKTRPADDLEFWLHNELTWVRWAQGDLAGARDEVEQARATLDHATIADDKARALRLHERWDRAYVAIEESLAKPPLGGETAATADRARADYEAIAKPANDHDGMAVLAAFFAVRKHDARAAGAEAKKVDVEKDTDLQDLYVIALAFDAAGDMPGAARVRARICAGNDYLMKPLIVRAMAAEGHACAP
jgi:ketosteroid isomerase-like protein